MASTKLIVVLGATGNQGGSVVGTFLEDAGWRVRGVTRDASSAKAQALKARGVEVVSADLDKPETLETAFKDSNAVFAVSDFWGLYSSPTNQDKRTPDLPLNVWAANHETQQLKNVIDAVAKVPTLERFVLSSLSNATKLSKGKYTHVYHFDSKATAADYGKENFPHLWAMTSIFQAGYFLNNYVTPMSRPQKNSNGTIQFIGGVDPDLKLPFIAPEEDTGLFVKALVHESAGKTVIGYRERLTTRELVQLFHEVTGLKAEAIMLSKEQLGSIIPPELKSELQDNMAYWNEFGYEGSDPEILHPKDLTTILKLETVKAYLKKQDWAKVLGL